VRSEVPCILFNINILKDEDIVRYYNENYRLIFLIRLISKPNTYLGSTVLNIIKRIGKIGAKCKCNRCSSTYITKDLYSSKKSKIGNLCPVCKKGNKKVFFINQSILKYWFNYDIITGLWTYKFTSINGFINKNATMKHSAGYLTIRIGGIDYLAHRLVFLYLLNYLPNQVDHINHIRNDNRWINLREVTNRENHLNESLSSNSKTKVLGVCLHKPTNKFRAYIMVHGKQIHLGLFDSIKEAELSREKANIKYSFHKNHGK